MVDKLARNFDYPIVNYGVGRVRAHLETPVKKWLPIIFFGKDLCMYSCTYVHYSMYVYDTRKLERNKSSLA